MYTYLYKPAFTTEGKQTTLGNSYLSGSCVATTILNRLKKEGSLSKSFSGLLNRRKKNTCQGTLKISEYSASLLNIKS